MAHAVPPTIQWCHDDGGSVRMIDQTRLPGELVAELKDEGYPVFGTYLNTSVKMKESHREHRPLIDMAPGHKLTAQFLDLHAELEKAVSRAAA